MGFRDDIATEAKAIREDVGVSVQYCRGDLSVTIQHAVKYPDRRRGPLDQVATEITTQDWGIGVEDLVIGGKLTEPRRDDRIVYGNEIYQVLPDQGDAVWHYVAADTQFRIHTKRKK